MFGVPRKELWIQKPKSRNANKKNASNFESMLFLVGLDAHHQANVDVDDRKYNRDKSLFFMQATNCTLADSMQW